MSAKLLKQIYPLTLILLAGILLPLAFAPFQFYPLAIICPAILLFTWLNADREKCFWRGFLFGLGFFGVGASWIFISIHNYGNTNFFLAGFITLLFVLILALFPACNGYFLARFFPKNDIYKLCFAFPASWVLFEWIRGWFLTGFPWLFLGMSQTNSPLRGFAPIMGELGVSFLVVLSSAILVILFYKVQKIYYANTIALLLLITLWTSGYFLTFVQWTTPAGAPIKVSLVQGNIPQQLKWSPEYAQSTLQTYLTLTQSHWNSQLIVWPEAAIPLLMQDAQDFIESLNEQAKQHHTIFITGIPTQKGFSYYNSLLLLNDGKQQIYDKRHLVPFGEYVPFENWLRGLIGFFDIPMSDFSAGLAKQSDLRAGNLTIAPFICYEIAYEQTALKELPQANILLTITDDAWFNHSLATFQHLQIAQFRALETGRPHLFATNNGITAIITPQGTIQAILPAFKAEVLTNFVTPMQGKTPIVFLGILPFIILFIGLLLISAFASLLEKN